MGEEPPKELVDLVYDAATFSAFNAMFEQLIWTYRWPDLPLPRFECTRALAAAHGLPQGLDRACKSLHIGYAKDIEGRRLINLYSLPRKDGTFNELEGEDATKMLQYCAKDVILSRRISQRLPALSEFEQKVYDWTAKTNLRGLDLDVDLAEKAEGIADALQKAGNNELALLTGNTIFSVSQIARIKSYLERVFGIATESLDKEAIEELLLRDSLPDTARRILELRRDLSQTSVKKFQRARLSVCNDGKVRDTLVYHGAATGRWTSQVVQFQNLPKYVVSDPETALKLVSLGDPKLFDLCYKHPMLALSGCARGMVIPPTGKKLAVVDYNAIEARVLLWAAGQQDAVDSFHQGRDIYVEMARTIYRNEKLTKENKKERNLGKTTVLGCLAEGSLVYSDTGYKPIEQINRGQRLWDGEQWVNFQELVGVGPKSVIQVGDLWLTPDHLLLTRDGWRTAGEIALNGGILLPRLINNLDISLLSAANLSGALNVWSLSAVHAGLKKIRELTSFGAQEIRCVIDALRVSTDNVAETPENMLISFLIRVYANGGLFVGGILNDAVRTQIAPTTNGMVLEAFPSPLSPVENSWNTLLHWIGGIGGAIPSIELIMPKGTEEEIFASLRRALTISTVETVKDCYDLIGADFGRFVAGNLIVHNCGYGMGHLKFQATCDTYGIDLGEKTEYDEREDKETKKDIKVWYAPLAKRAVETYRTTYSQVPKFWYGMQAAAEHCVRTGKDSSYAAFHFSKERDFLYLMLPSGRRLAYHRPGIDQDGLYYYTEDSASFNYVKKRTYGGRLVENAIQATARDILAHGILELEWVGFDVIMTVHDENIVVVENKEELEVVEKIMCALPDWAKGCPITAEGFITDRYRKG